MGWEGAAIAWPLQRKPLWGWGWDGWEGSLFQEEVYFALMPRPWHPRTETSPRGHDLAPLPSSAQLISPFWLLEGIELRSQSSGVGGIHVVLAQTVVLSCLPPATQLGLVTPEVGRAWLSWGPSMPDQTLLLLSPWPGDWFPALSLLPGPSLHPLCWATQACLSAPVAASEACPALQPGLCVRGQAAPGPRWLCSQQAPVFAQCRFCSMSTSCSSHVVSVLPDSSCWWGQLAPLL